MNTLGAAEGSPWNTTLSGTVALHMAAFLDTPATPSCCLAMFIALKVMCVCHTSMQVFWVFLTWAPAPHSEKGAARPLAFLQFLQGPLSPPPTQRDPQETLSPEAFLLHVSNRLLPSRRISGQGGSWLQPAPRT